MIAFVAVSVLICGALVIGMIIALSSQLDAAVDDVRRIKEIVREMNVNVPYNSWFMSTYKDLNERLNSLEETLTTEIACLATKNNEDIKRMKGDYAVGDILKFGGIRMRVFGKDTLDDGRTRWKLFGENGGEYRIYTDDIPRDLEFLGHRDLSFD